VKLKRNEGMQLVRVRLTRKFAESIDGVSLSGRRVGDVFDLVEAEARLLFAEQWAEPAERQPSENADTSASPVVNEVIADLAGLGSNPPRDQEPV
jgi:hypothetical protein